MMYHYQKLKMEHGLNEEDTISLRSEIDEVSAAVLSIIC